MKMSSRIFRTRGGARGAAEAAGGMEKRAGRQAAAHEAGSGPAPPADAPLHRAIREQAWLLSLHPSSFTAQGAPDQT